MFEYLVKPAKGSASDAKPDIRTTPEAPPKLLALLERCVNDPALTGITSGREPLALWHLAVRQGAEKYSLLGRVDDSGEEDVSSNPKRRHVMALTTEERPASGPAACIVDEQPWKPQRIKGTRDLAQRTLPEDDHPASRCRVWERTTGDAGWAGILVESFLAGQNANLIVSSSEKALPLLIEAIALLPPTRRWEVSFTTNYDATPEAGDFRWRFIVSGSAAESATEGERKTLRLDLTRVLKQAEGGEYVALARSGPESDVVSGTVAGGAFGGEDLADLPPRSEGPKFTPPDEEFIRKANAKRKQSRVKQKKDGTTSAVKENISSVLPLLWKVLPIVGVIALIGGLYWIGNRSGVGTASDGQQPTDQGRSEAGAEDGRDLVTIGATAKPGEFDPFAGASDTASLIIPGKAAPFDLLEAKRELARSVAPPQDASEEEWQFAWGAYSKLRSLWSVLETEQKREQFAEDFPRWAELKTKRDEGWIEHAETLQTSLKEVEEQVSESDGEASPEWNDERSEQLAESLSRYRTIAEAGIDERFEAVLPFPTLSEALDEYEAERIRKLIAKLDTLTEPEAIRKVLDELEGTDLPDSVITVRDRLRDFLAAVENDTLSEWLPLPIEEPMGSLAELPREEPLEIVLETLALPAVKTITPTLLLPVGTLGTDGLGYRIETKDQTMTVTHPKADGETLVLRLEPREGEHPVLRIDGTKASDRLWTLFAWGGLRLTQGTFQRNYLLHRPQRLGERFPIASGKKPLRLELPAARIATDGDPVPALKWTTATVAIEKLKLNFTPDPETPSRLVADEEGTRKLFDYLTAAIPGEAGQEMPARPILLPKFDSDASEPEANGLAIEQSITTFVDEVGYRDLKEFIAGRIESWIEEEEDKEVRKKAKKAYDPVLKALDDGVFEALEKLQELSSQNVRTAAAAQRQQRAQRAVTLWKGKANAIRDRIEETRNAAIISWDLSYELVGPDGKSETMPLGRFVAETANPQTP